MFFEVLAPEIAFSHFVQSFSSSSLDSFFLTITFLGNPAFWFGLSAFLYWKGDEKKSFFLALTILFASAVTGILKELTMRPRPTSEQVRVMVEEYGYAFPSGHAATIGGIFGYYWEKFMKNAKIAGLIIVLLVLLSRIYLGVHFLGDVVVGGLFGFLIGRMIHYGEKKYHNIRLDRKKVLEETAIIVSVACALAVSLMFRPFALASGLFGYFAGIFSFKLLNRDSTKVSGKALWAKEIFGFLVLGALLITSNVFMVEPEAYFLGGLWITLIYPFLYEKAVSKKLIPLKL